MQACPTKHVHECVLCKCPSISVCAYLHMHMCLCMSVNAYLSIHTYINLPLSISQYKSVYAYLSLYRRRRGGICQEQVLMLYFFIILLSWFSNTQFFNSYIYRLKVLESVGHTLTVAQRHAHTNMKINKQTNK